jgi:hypothetical protein
MTRDVFGADLHEGDALICADGIHRIDHFGPYPGRWVGYDEDDHVRRAYDGNGWCRTVADHEPFHIQIGD